MVVSAQTTFGYAFRSAARIAATRSGASGFAVFLCFGLDLALTTCHFSLHYPSRSSISIGCTRTQLKMGKSFSV